VSSISSLVTGRKQDEVLAIIQNSGRIYQKTKIYHTATEGAKIIKSVY